MARTPYSLGHALSKDSYRQCKTMTPKDFELMILFFRMNFKPVCSIFLLCPPMAYESWFKILGKEADEKEDDNESEDERETGNDMLQTAVIEVKSISCST